MNPDIIIRCHYCDTELRQKRVSTDSVTGVTTIYVDECKPCIDEAFGSGMDSVYDEED